MQIHKSKNKTKRKQTLWWIVGAALLVLALFIVNFNLKRDSILCDMESRTADGKRFINNGNSFSHGQTQSDHMARSGMYSAKLDKNTLYGPGYEFEHVYSGDVYEASVWMNNDNGFGTLAFSGSWGFFAYQKESIKSENGWHFLKKRITVPVGVYDATLLVYTFTNKDSNAIYFDDIRVEKISSGNAAALPTLSDDPNKKLNIIVDKDALDKLKEKRIDAYTHGSLISGKADLVPAKIEVGRQSLDAEVRLKGDLLDHLSGRKWSFRIHTKDGSAWQGMKVFSVHNSKSRDHLSEWVFHQMLAQEDVLTTKYDFVEVALNGETLGMYAYEEHFLKQLLQAQGRSEGPILKISEDAHWQYAPRSFGKHLAYYESAQIEPFDKDALKNSNTTLAAFEKGQELLYGFIHGDLEVEDVFDVERFAKFMAIQDACRAWHSFNYTNLRFYFNAQSGRLEPIGYDGYGSDGLTYAKALYILGSQVNSSTDELLSTDKFVNKFHKKIFVNLNFAERYTHYLALFTSADYLEGFKQKNEKALREREQFIKQVHVNYSFSWDDFFIKAKDVQEVMAPAAELSLKAYRDGSEVVLRSYHLLPLEVLGFGNKEMTSKVSERVILESYDKKEKVLEQSVADPTRAKRVFVRTLGTGMINSFPIYKWTAPTNEKALATKLITNIDFPFLIDSPEAYIIPSGAHVLRKSLVIKDKQLIIQSGAELDLQNGASIISGHSIQALGNVDSPIVIRSSNTTGQGLVLLNAQVASNFKSCTFDNLQSAKQYSLYTDGGVNVFGSEVNFTRCVFSNAKSKDALHLDRSQYELLDCIITQSSGDGIDANFSTGQIKGLITQDIGKDGLEVSGGFCRVDNSQLKNTTSCAVNVNHHGTTELVNLSISDSAEGVKSTDLAEVTINKLQLKNVGTGVLAFRKNDEMGGGTITIKDMELENVAKRNVHDMHSTIILDRQELPSQ